MAVLLSKFEGMSYAEIAEVMEISPQALKSLLSRAQGEPPRSAATVLRPRRQSDVGGP